ncbi:MAG: PQQ-binding-like beta-propeller repeat protein [Armatimonadota bacterium]|jgi:outer membrane protein assembly factor BamB
MLRSLQANIAGLLALMLVLGVASPCAAEDWLQFKYDCGHSGNAPGRDVTPPLGLVGAIPLTDAILTAPVIADGRIYAVDGSGVAFCIDAATLRVIWKVATRGGNANCNNVSSPAIAGDYLHFGTMVGSYYVLALSDGAVVKEIRCGDPVFSTPVVGEDRVYFATLGSRVYALEPNGTVCWTWDYVKERLDFDGDRWSGADWLKHKEGRATWRDQFLCSRNVALHERTVVVPAGGETVWLRDAGDKAELRAIGLVPPVAGREPPATFGLSVGEDGAVYRQWHRRDNAGRVEIMRLRDGEVATDFVPGTETAINLPGLLSFCSVSMRGEDVYRCRPEKGFGLCRHSAGREQPEYLGGYPSVSPPVLLRDEAVYGGLDGSLYVAPLSGGGKAWSFETAFGKAIGAPAAVCDGRIYFGCEDGYLYVLGPGGEAPPPSRDLRLSRIRSPLKGRLAGARYDWFTNFGNFANTNANDQGIRPPFGLKWIRRYKGTFKHIPVCGGGRVYTHTAEGQIVAVEQDTGRLLWRRYWPGVYISFTAPLYYKERLLVPQAGMKGSRLRCLDAATGELLWAAPFTGSPSWSRQAPPVVHRELAIYMFGSGKYAVQGTEKAFVHKGDPVPVRDDTEIMSWIYSHNNPYYPQDNKPLIRAWDMATGRMVWERDFSELGSGGNDSGVCLLGDTLYYSTFFGYAATARRRGLPAATGVTAALDPRTGEVLWTNTDYSVTAGCTISGEDGRLYIGGYNKPNETTNDRHVWCLDAGDGSLIWESEPLPAAINVVTVGGDFVFTNAYGKDGYMIDKGTGKIIGQFNKGYACTRFTLSGSYLMGANMDVIDLSDESRLLSSGPCVDVRECVGGSVSNGRIFYTAQASGLQTSQVCGEEAESWVAPWQATAR